MAEGETRSNAELGSNTVDRISALPNPIIHYIFSTLPTQYLVQASIFSKRWRNLWCSAPTLYFDIKQFIFPCGIDNTMEVSLDDLSRFIKFVDSVLLMRDRSCLQKLHFSWSYPHTSRAYNHVRYIEKPQLSCLNEWIDYAVRHHVQILDLDLDPELYNEKPQLPSSLLTCGSLAELKLMHIFILRLPTSVTLSGLRIMHLFSVQFCQDQQLTRALFSACPILESLVLSNCRFVDHQIVGINALRLRNLSIRTLYSNLELPLRVDIFTPSLVQLTLYLPRRTNQISDCYLLNSPSVINAYIDTVECWDSSNLIHLLTALPKVQTMNLSGFSCLQGDLLEKSSISFEELSSLIVKFSGWINKCGIPLIATLLKCSPKIESLSIVFDWGRSFEPKIWTKEKMSNFSSLYHLKTVEITGFTGIKIQLEFLKCLLEKAVVLQRLTIVCLIFCKYDDKTEEEKELNRIREELLRCPRASSNVVLVCSAQERRGPKLLDF